MTTQQKPSTASQAQQQGESSPSVQTGSEKKPADTSVRPQQGTTFRDWASI